MMRVIGWDIGGVKTKAAFVAGGVPQHGVTRPFELQRAPAALDTLLIELTREAGAAAVDAHAVTMTAELSQMFRTKRDGVHFILGAVERAFPGVAVHVYTTQGTFGTPDVGRTQ